MKLLLKRLGQFSAFLLLLGLTIPFFLRSGYRVEKAMYINANIDSLYDQISDLGRWSEWDSWEAIDYFSKWQVENGVRSWESKNPRVRTGEMRIIKQQPLASVYLEVKIPEQNLVFKPRIYLEKLKDGVEIRFLVEGQFDYFERYRNLFYHFQNEIGLQFELSLENLALLNGDTL